MSTDQVEAPDVEDPEIDQLDGQTREAVARIWLLRASSELTAAGVFGNLAAMARHRATACEVSDLLTRAAEDEVRHAELCRAVASRYLREPAAHPDAATGDLPVFGVASPALNTTLNIVLNSCINETVAAELLRECREEARGRVARRALRLLLRDEIDHARIGWAHLASAEVTPQERREVGRALPVLIRIAREAWNRGSPTTSDAATGHGWVSDARVAAIFEDVLREVLLPGFAHVGVDF
jgi:hypothetical protein